MTKNKSKTVQIFSWVLTICRVLVGMVVIKTGFDPAKGASTFYSSQNDNFITGLFAIIVGTYFVFSSVFRELFDLEYRE